MKMHYFFIFSTLLFFSERTFPYTVTTNAEYKPMPYDIGKSAFKLTDKCDANIHAIPCKNGLSQAIRISDVNITRRLQYAPDILWHRKVYFQVKGEKKITLRHTKSGASYVLRFRLTHIGHRSQQDAGNSANLIQAGCSQYFYSGSSVVMNGLFKLSENVQKNGGLCNSRGWSASFPTEDILVTDLHLVYDLTPPDPLLMENGLYQGVLRLYLGSEKDIDLGAGPYGVTYIDFKFNFTVKHQIKVDFPAGSGNVILTPPGGWGEGLYGRGKHTPDSLENTLPARIWSASPYNIYLKCQYINSTGNSCQIKNRRYDHKASVQVYGTDNDNRSWLLRPDASRHFNISSSIILDASRPFKFKVLKADVAEMMDYPGSTYKGNITLVIDAKI